MVVVHPNLPPLDFRWLSPRRRQACGAGSWRQMIRGSPTSALLHRVAVEVHREEMSPHTQARWVPVPAALWGVCSGRHGRDPTPFLFLVGG